MTKDDNVIGHILPRVENEKQCEAWVNLFRKFEGVEIEKVEWDSRKEAYQIRAEK